MAADELRCRGTNAEGDPCGAPSSTVDTETGFCPAHGPGGPEKLREIAKKGGAATARKLKRKGLDEGELPPLESPQAAERWLEVVGRAVATGKLGHHAGKAIVKAVREWIRAREAGEQTERLEALEEKLAAFKRGELEVIK